MTRSIRAAYPAALTGALLASALAVGAVTASGGSSGRLESSMAGIPAGLTGQVLMGVQGGGLPWSLGKGEASLAGDGRLHVEVEGLVLAAGANAGINPIPTGVAIVACDGAVAAQSGPVPFSRAGDAEVDATLILPSPCVAPVIFFAGATGAGPRWFAVTGF